MLNSIKNFPLKVCTLKSINCGWYSIPSKSPALLLLNVYQCRIQRLYGDTVLLVFTRFSVTLNNKGLVSLRYQTFYNNSKNKIILCFVNQL